MHTSFTICNRPHLQCRFWTKKNGSYSFLRLTFVRLCIDLLNTNCIVMIVILQECACRDKKALYFISPGDIADNLINTEYMHMFYSELKKMIITNPQQSTKSVPTERKFIDSSYLFWYIFNSDQKIILIESMSDMISLPWQCVKLC